MKIERVCMGCKDKQDSIDLLSNEIDSLKRDVQDLANANAKLHTLREAYKTLKDEHETYIKSLERRLCELQEK